jgi:cytoskeletal protein CcmA (bactofilin family)
MLDVRSRLPPANIFRNLPDPKNFWDSQCTRCARICFAHISQIRTQQGAYNMLQPNDKFATPDRSAPSFGPSGATKNFSASPEQATIGRSIIIKGEVSGAETLYVDGRIEGTINMPESRVTVGRNGVIVAAITAREVVVMGTIEGDLVVTDRVDIRSDGSVTGDIRAERLTIEEGAFLKGGIDLGKADKRESEKAASMAAHA